jgi:hypothetical protein
MLRPAADQPGVALGYRPCAGFSDACMPSHITLALGGVREVLWSAQQYEASREALGKALKLLQISLAYFRC